MAVEHLTGRPRLGSAGARGLQPARSCTRVRVGAVARSESTGAKLHHCDNPLAWMREEKARSVADAHPPSVAAVALHVAASAAPSLPARAPLGAGASRTGGGGD